MTKQPPIPPPSHINRRFPLRLYQILEQADTNEDSNIISWLPSGNGFKVHHRTAFETKILRQHFTAIKYKSFQRQLHLYGFKRILMGMDRGGYVHPFLVRGHPEECELIRRSKQTHKRRKSHSVACITEISPVVCGKQVPNEPIRLKGVECERVNDLELCIDSCESKHILTNENLKTTIPAKFVDDIINIFGSDSSSCNSSAKTDNS